MMTRLRESLDPVTSAGDEMASTFVRSLTELRMSAIDVEIASTSHGV